MKRFPFYVCLFFLLLLVMAGIPVAAASPVITGVSPSSGPLGEVVTVTVYGSGFDSTSTVTLAKCGLKDNSGTYGLIRGSITGWSANHITATFSISGSLAVVGDYDVRATTRTGFGTEIAVRDKGFLVYKGSGSSIETTTATTTTTRTATTSPTTAHSGDNSVFFETNPPGATIYLSGDEIGTSTFTYYTYRDGTYDVRVKKSGYEDYEGKVTILQGQRVYFYALLTPLASSTSTAAATASQTSSPSKTTTTLKKSTIKVPTPWGTDPPVAEESPVDPATVPLAAALGIAVVVIRRR
jgi:hypothetical protein